MKASEMEVGETFEYEGEKYIVIGNDGKNVYVIEEPPEPGLFFHPAAEKGNLILKSYEDYGKIMNGFLCGFLGDLTIGDMNGGDRK